VTDGPVPALLLEAELALRLARLRLRYDRDRRRPAAGARCRSATAEARGRRGACRRTAELTADLRDRADTDRQLAMSGTTRGCHHDARYPSVSGGRWSGAVPAPRRAARVVGGLMSHLVPESDPDCRQDPEPCTHRIASRRAGNAHRGDPDLERADARERPAGNSRAAAHPGLRKRVAHDRRRSTYRRPDGRQLHGHPAAPEDDRPRDREQCGH